MTNVIGVRFRHVGKVYYFAPGELEIRAGDCVIVETARGIEYGEVRQGIHEVEDSEVTQPLKEVIRLATAEDAAHEAENREREKEAFKTCKQKICEKNLDMKLIYCEYTFDNSKVLFYFTADGRVDFRDLVKELAGIFRTRIELRQVGVRDETKLLGGLGSCGRPLCCATWLTDFAPVSIKMAKEQNLSLNPVKISGVCGRLMCCLGNEEEVYEELNRKLPGVGDLVDLADGSRGEVHSVGILKQLVKVVVELPGDEKEIREYPADEVTVRVRRRDKNRMREQAESRERELRKERERGEREHGSREHGGRTEQPAEIREGETAAPGSEEKKARSDRRNRRDRGENRDRNPGENRGEDRSDNRGERQDRGEEKERGSRREREPRENGSRRERGSREGREDRTNREVKEGETRPEANEKKEGGEHRRRHDHRDRRDRSDRGNGERREKGSAEGKSAESKPAESKPAGDNKAEAKTEA